MYNRNPSQPVDDCELQIQGFDCLQTTTNQCVTEVS